MKTQKQLCLLVSRNKKRQWKYVNAYKRLDQEAVRIDIRRFLIQGIHAVRRKTYLFSNEDY